MMQGVECLKVEQHAETVEMLLENSEKDTIIKLKYQSEINVIDGNIKELKKFWDVA